MNSANNTRQSSAASRVFLVDGLLNKYRWVGPRSDSDGAMLVRVRHASVAAGWHPVGVQWVPETISRPDCDFPIFYSVVRCFSRKALQILSPIIGDALEVLSLDGLDDRYVGIHCIRWVEGAANFEGVDQRRVSIHSAAFVPCLYSQLIVGLDVFGVPEMITKLFVSERFKLAVESHKLSGLEFKEVSLS